MSELPLVKKKSASQKGSDKDPFIGDEQPLMTREISPKRSEKRESIFCLSLKNKERRTMALENSCCIYLNDTRFFILR